MAAPANPTKSRLAAFASGKGGVGKTVCAANLAVHLAARRQVLSVDMDLGSGNLNTVLGVRTLPNSVNDFIFERLPTLGPLKATTAVPGLQLIGCSYNPMGSTQLDAAQKDRLIDSFRADDADYVLMDLGAGVSDDVLDLFAAADVPVLVTGPESLALHNAFVFVKSYVYRAIAKSLDHIGLSKRTRENIVRQLYASGDQEISRTIERVGMRDPATAAAMRNVIADIRIHLIMNKLQDPSEERFVKNLQRLTRKYADVSLNYLGAIPYDHNVKKSLNDIVPFALEYKSSPANLSLNTIANKLDVVLRGPLAQPSRQSNSGSIGKMVTSLGHGISAVASLFRPAGDGIEASERRSIEEYETKFKLLSEELRDARTTYENAKLEWQKEREEIVRAIQTKADDTDVLSGHEASLQLKTAIIDKLRADIQAHDLEIERLQQTAAALVQPVQPAPPDAIEPEPASEGVERSSKASR